MADFQQNIDAYKAWVLANPVPTHEQRCEVMDRLCIRTHHVEGYYQNCTTSPRTIVKDQNHGA